MSATQREAEKQFAKKLKKAGWHTYREDEFGRVVTNAYEDERIKLQKISGLRCEVVSRPFGEGCCVCIGPIWTVPTTPTPEPAMDDTTLPPLPRMTHYGGTAVVLSAAELRARDAEVARAALASAPAIPSAQPAPEAHEFGTRLAEFGVAMFHRQGEKARVLAQALEAMFKAAAAPAATRAQAEPVALLSPDKQMVHFMDGSAPSIERKMAHWMCGWTPLALASAPVGDGGPVHPDTERLDWLLLNSEFNPETTTYFWNSPDERKASGRAEIDAARAAQAGDGKP